MYSLFFIARNNIKKRKGDSAVLLLLTALATLLLYTSATVLTGTDIVIEDSYNKNNTADLLFMSNLDKVSEITDVITSSDDVSEFEVSECLYVIGGKCRKDKNRSKKELAFIVNAADDKRNISSQKEIDSNSMGYDDIWLPYYMKSAEKYNIGDECYITLADKEYRFKVAGFTEDVLFATPLNISVYNIYISDECMEDIKDENPSLEQAVYNQYKVRLNKNVSAQEFDEKISTKLISEIPELGSKMNLGLNSETMKGGVAVLSNITMGIILIFSAVLIIVAVIIMRFSIRNFTELNIKNIGILKASGYTGRQLKAASVLETGIISFLGIMAGNLIGIFTGKLIGSFQGIMLGLNWSRGYDAGIALLSSAVVFLIIICVSGVTSRIYGKVTVLDALRGGIHTHNFRKNYFPLEKSRFPYPIVLAGKNIFGEKLKNFSILLIVMLLSFATFIGCALYRNFASSTDKVLEMIGAEAGNLGFTGENIEEAGEEIEEWEETESVLYYSSVTTMLSNGSHKRSVTCDIWKNPAKLRNEMIVNGRLPQYDNEIVLTTNVASVLKVDVGDVIYVESSGKKLDYVVSGIDQKINNMGMKALMNMEGAFRLNGESKVLTVYIYTKEGVTYKEMEKKVSESFPNIRVMNSEKWISEITQGVVTGIVAICVFFLAITFIVVIMVEILLIKSKVVKEQKIYGISKALGYTTRQLIIQTMMTNMPVIAAGSLTGIILSIFLLNPLVVMFFKFAGIQKCTLDISLSWLFITVIGIITIAAVTSVLSALRIRKIEPVKLLKEDA